MRNNVRISRMLMVIAAGIIACTAAAGQESAREVLENLRKTYDGITDAELKFTQTTRLPLGHVDQNVHGSLTLKKEHKYTIELGDQTIVTDGTTVWSYSRATNQVLIDRFRQDKRMLTPERLLTGSPEGFAASLLGRDHIGKTGVVLVKLVPTDEQSLITSIRMWVDEKEWMIKQVEVVDANGRQSTYTVQHVKTNIGLPDSQFVFQIPQGADVVDMR